MARKEGGSWKHAMGAGIAIMLAGMLRYEGWTLTPLLAFSLRKRRRWMLIFLAAAAAHPLFWMIGNWAHHDDPLFFYHHAMWEELSQQGNNERLSPGGVLRRLVAFPLLTLRGITPLMSLLCLAGTTIALMRRRKCSDWLLPLAASLCLYVVLAVRGGLLTLSAYTSFLGALLFPFAALAYDRLGIAKYAAGKRLLLELIILASMISFSYPPRPLDEHCFTCPVSAIPIFDEQKDTQALSGLINQSLKRSGGGFICDFFWMA